mgnify:CR=1 FL=1
MHQSETTENEWTGRLMRHDTRAQESNILDQYKDNNEYSR